MQKIKKLYRSEYDGEEVITEAIYQSANWTLNKEYVGKDFDNNQTSNRAVVIGNGPSRSKFKLSLLKKPKGVFGEKTFQTYGCNALYRDFDPDFLVVTGPKFVNEIVNTNVKGADYCQTHIVYSNTNFILEYPGRFHLLPQDPNWNAGAIAAYLACFDGHKKVYLVGHDGNDTPGTNNNIYAGTNAYAAPNESQTDSFWSQSLSYVIDLYSEVDFVLVNETGRGYMPELWKKHINLRRLSFQKFIAEADIF